MREKKIENSEVEPDIEATYIHDTIKINNEEKQKKKSVHEIPKNSFFFQYFLSKEGATEEATKIIINGIRQRADEWAFYFF